MDTKTSLFVTALFTFVVAVGWATSEHGMCDYDLIRSVLAEHSKDGAVSCFDFWFNRYQTLIGVVGALGAAWAAWVGVKQQITRLDRQVQIARVQFASAYLENITERMAIVDRIQDEFDHMKKYVTNFELALERFLSSAFANGSLTAAEIDDLYSSRSGRRAVFMMRDVKGEMIFENSMQLINLVGNAKVRAQKILVEIDSNILTSSFQVNVRGITVDTIALCHLIETSRDVVMRWHETLRSTSDRRMDFPRFGEYYHQVKYEEYKRVSGYLIAERARLERLRDQTTDDADHALT